MISRGKPVDESARRGIVMGAATLLLVVMALVIFPRLPENYLGPRTEFGYYMGVAALVMAFVSTLYSIRRAHMRLKVGKLETWLRIHTYTAMAALLFAYLHCDWRFRPGAASAALLLLILTNISGVVGWVIYLTAPPRIKKDDNDVIDSPEEIYARMDKLHDRVESLYKRLEKTTGSEDDIMEKIASHKAEIENLEEQLSISMRRESLIGAWMYFHIPVSMAFLVTAFVHAFVTIYLL